MARQKKREDSVKISDEDSANLLDDIKKDINKSLGEESAYLLEDSSPSDVDVFIPTGSTLLDYMISNRRNGGIPVGRITEISGLQGVGKSLLAMHICANAQKLGGLPIYIDTENAFNSDFAARVGLDISKNFLYLNPASVEDVYKVIFSTLNKLEEAQKKNKTSSFPFLCVVWDSIAATPVSQQVENEDPHQNTIALKPRILSTNNNLLLKMSSRRSVAFVFLNQLRMKIGATLYEDPYITPGGMSIPYSSSVRIKLASSTKIKAEEEVVGVQTRATIIKTRLGPPHRSCMFPIYFTHGIDDNESILQFLEDNNLVGNRNAGSKGKLFYIEGLISSENAINRVELKKRMKTDKQLMSKILDIVEEKAVKKLINPEEVDIVFVPSGEEI
jgi:recombination protein RecA